MRPCAAWNPFRLGNSECRGMSNALSLMAFIPHGTKRRGCNSCRKVALTAAGTVPRAKDAVVRAKRAEAELKLQQEG